MREGVVWDHQKLEIPFRAHHSEKGSMDAHIDNNIQNMLHYSRLSSFIIYIQNMLCTTYLLLLFFVLVSVYSYDSSHWIADTKLMRAAFNRVYLL